MRRWATREVLIGKVGVGGKHPIRIQSMTTTSTRDIPATAEQIMRLADVGCEIARVTVQGIKEAESCEGIKNLLLQKGYDIPLVADIHFYPPAALRVADSVDKVRINPGNFVDPRARFVLKEYDDASYAQELCKIEQIFAPLVEKCKRLKRALRIGTNHGSLSDRIMNRYGDTASGMVESALEFARICRQLDYHDFLFSMKASNPLVMVEAYRLLVDTMQKLDWNYPLHLGVTEAGDGEDGRVKSAAGIGSLLLDGLGDTIRISLTEDPWCEIDPCKRLIAFVEKTRDPECPPFSGKRPERPLQSILPHRSGSVIGSSSKADFRVAENFLICAQTGQEIPVFTAHCFSETPREPYGIEIVEPDDWSVLKTHTPAFVLFAPKTARLRAGRAFFQWLSDNQLQVPVFLSFSYEGAWDDIVIAAATECGALLIDGLAEGLFLYRNNLKNRNFGKEAPQNFDSERATIAQRQGASENQNCEVKPTRPKTDSSGCFGIPKLTPDLAVTQFESDYKLLDKSDALAFTILQALRRRASRTEFISCPGCGRTLFDLQTVTQRIRARTGHLPGVKIAVMGCVVNGPGEMADADFGYVGSKTGKVDLYVGKQCVKKDIDAADAVEELVSLIQAHGLWKEGCKNVQSRGYTEIT